MWRRRLTSSKSDLTRFLRYWEGSFKVVPCGLFNRALNLRTDPHDSMASKSP